MILLPGKEHIRGNRPRKGQVLCHALHTPWTQGDTTGLKRRDRAGRKPCAYIWTDGCVGRGDKSLRHSVTQGPFVSKGSALVGDCAHLLQYRLRSGGYLFGQANFGCPWHEASSPSAISGGNSSTRASRPLLPVRKISSSSGKTVSGSARAAAVISSSLISRFAREGVRESRALQRCRQQLSCRFPGSFSCFTPCDCALSFVVT